MKEGHDGRLHAYLPFHPHYFASLISFYANEREIVCVWSEGWGDLCLFTALLTSAKTLFPRFPLVLTRFFRKQAVCIRVRSCVLVRVPRWHGQPCSTATACQCRYDNHSPDDWKRHPSMSYWRAIPAQGFDARKDSIHWPNQKAVAVKLKRETEKEK